MTLARRRFDRPPQVDGGRRRTRLRGHAGNAGDGVQAIRDQLAPGPQSFSHGFDFGVLLLECRGDGMLQGVVGREASAFHFRHGFAPIAHDFFRTRDDGPANTPTRCHICLGQPIERDHGDFSINRSNRRWSFSGEHKLVVDFVGKDHGARGFASGNNVFKNYPGVTEPVGLLGLMSTKALAGVESRLVISSTSGCQSLDSSKW